MSTNHLFKVMLFAGIFAASNISNAKTITIQEPFMSAPASMGKVILFHDEAGFHISQNNKTCVIEKCWIDSSLQNISSEELEKFLVTGYISISQMDNGEISLTAKNLVRGGGPLTGLFAYWVVKTVCYGTAVAGAAGAVVTTGGVAGAVTGTLVVGATAGASAGAALVGGAIAGGGLVAEAGMATTAVITSAGGLAAAAAAVETVSLGALTFFTGLMFLP